MNIVVAPDSFKECLSAKAVAAAISKGIMDSMPDAEIYQIPISDGGEGMLEAIMQGARGTMVQLKVRDPLMRMIDAEYGILSDKRTAVVEMAKASGLELLREEEKNPMLTSTFGTGQLIKDALAKGCTKIIVGIGGSATNDGGVGMLRALGAKFLNEKGEELNHGGAGLANLNHIDLTDFDDRLRHCEVLVACDVSNPLTGNNGASLVYGGQKGGSPETLKVLDENLRHYAHTIKRQLNIDIDKVPGAGAAGGIGAALMAFMNGKLVNGIGLILETIQMEKYIEKADLVITGEGKIDAQTLHGKTIAGMAKMAKKHDVPVLVITGKIGEGIAPIYDMGVSAIYSIVNRPMDLKSAISDAPVLIQQCINNVMRTIHAINELSETNIKSKKEN